MHNKEWNHKHTTEFDQEIEDILNGVSTHHRPQDSFDFSGFIFLSTDFSRQSFNKTAVFTSTEFPLGARFDGAQFLSDAKFVNAVFKKETSFFQTKFLGSSLFFLAQFHGDVDFSSSRFTHGASFRLATFGQKADFSLATFGPHEEDQQAVHDSKRQIADFTGVSFKQPKEVSFYKANEHCTQGLLARFVNCEVQSVRFDDVNWYRPRGRLLLQDEIDIVSPPAEQTTDPLIQRDEYGLVTIIYRQLVSNFEKVRNYDLAEECYVGAMEMKRLNPSNFVFARRLSRHYSQWRWLRWLGEQLSTVNFYRWASEYGSNYRRAAEVLVFWLILFAIGFAVPWAGVQQNPRYASPSPHTANLWIKASEAYLNGWLHSLEVATFQRETQFVTSTDFGRLVAIAESIFVPAQVALLLLALRRRFRRTALGD